LSYGNSVTEIFKNRAPLDAQLLEQELLLRQCLWQNAIIKDEVTSTNDIARELVASNTEEGTFVLANFQTNGRGRQNRNWEAPKNSSIFISIILKPNNEKNLGWIPLLVGLALHKALEAETRKDIKIKWPNDLVLVENSQEFKFAGILVERIKNQVIVGVGINFDQEKEELPVSNASSLKQILQSSMAKESVIAAFLTELSARWLEENNASTWPTPSLVRDYKTNCITLNKKITAQLPGGEVINAEAVDISQTGEIVVKTDDGTRSLSSADIHLIS
jgi:BirA family transcriptional regulator, biotin operon repressor / biotin---[acetyl-CoA-carboxylase] ligase